ncbi:MAG TPA: hypothetical protein VFP52_00805, partial [Myxococcales bacterium]|nr:hypothetical protein [Myxococcales bacterium]
QLTRHPVGDVAISARHVAAFDLADRALRIWETASGRELGPVAGTFSGKLSFDSSGSFLAAKEDRAADDSAIRVWALPEMRETGRLPAKRVEKFSLGPEGKMVALVVSEQDPRKGSYSSYLDLLEIAGGRRIARIAVGEAVRPVFHPRGDALIAVAENEVRIFDLSSGRMRAALRQEEPIAGIRFSPDRETLATVSPDGVNVWNAVTGELLSQVSSDEGFEDAAFAGGGRYLLTGGAKHAAVLWLWKSEDLRDEACKRLMRNLAPDEWLRYLGDAPYRRSCPNLGDEAAAAATAR